MINIWIMDDDITYAKDIEMLIKGYNYKGKFENTVIKSGNINIINSEYDKKIDSILGLNKIGKHLFILDIDLKESYTGIKLAKKIRQRDRHSNIIFISSHIELMCKVFTHNLKVMTFIDKMNVSIEKALYSALDNIVDECNDAVNFKAVSKGDVGKLSYNYKGVHHYIPYNDIIAIETNTIKRGLKINTQNRTYEYRKSLKDLMIELPKEFVQVHRSVVLNAKNVREIQHKDTMYSILMKNDELYPSTPNFVNNLVSLLEN